MELVKNLKQINIIKYILVILLSSTLLAISAKLKIPFYPVPMTMQTFVVLLIGVCFGWRLGGAIITFYLLEGIVGFPVFSGTPEKGLGIEDLGIKPSSMHTISEDYLKRYRTRY